MNRRFGLKARHKFYRCGNQAGLHVVDAGLMVFCEQRTTGLRQAVSSLPKRLVALQYVHLALLPDLYLPKPG